MVLARRGAFCRGQGATKETCQSIATDEQHSHRQKERARQDQIYLDSGLALPNSRDSPYDATVVNRAATSLLAIAAIAGCHRDHAPKPLAAAVNASPMASPSPAEPPVAVISDAAPSFAEAFHHAGCKPTAVEPAAPQSSALASTTVPTPTTDGCTAPPAAPPVAASSALPPR